MTYEQQKCRSKNMLEHMKSKHEKLKKLCEKDVIEIKIMIRDGKTSREIAEKYNVTQPCINSIKNGFTWHYVRI